MHWVSLYFLKVCNAFMLFVQNFLSNSLHLHNPALVSKVWEAISAEIFTKVWNELCTIVITIIILFVYNNKWTFCCPSVLWHCWLTIKQSIRSVKKLFKKLSERMLEKLTVTLGWGATAVQLWYCLIISYFHGAGLPGCRGQ